MTNADSPRPTTAMDRVILDSIDEMVSTLVARLEGITDDEYLWEPVAGMWNVRPHAEGAVVDFDDDRDIDPAPVTTIAWRLWHVASDCFRSYHARLVGEADVHDPIWTLSAADAVARLEACWGGLRAALVRHEDWYDELGEAFGPWHRHCVADLAVHASNELVHHGAEIALFRDLYAARSDRGVSP